jgi:lysophospholipase L1-like esterase
VQQSDKFLDRRQTRSLRKWERHNQHKAYLFLITLCVILFCASGCSILPSGQTSSATLQQGSVQQAPKARLTYVAIGASDTYGIGTDNPQTQSWPSDLSDKLGNGVRLVNLGVPGVHADSALHVEVPIALDTHPDLITIWLAVNDLADNVPLTDYTRSMDSILTQLQKLPSHTRIVVANVPYVTLLPRFQNANAQELHARISAYNAVIASLVQKHHVLLVDLYARWQDLANHPDYISDDGFHPNAFGYAAIATIFYQVLQENPK